MSRNRLAAAGAALAMAALLAAPATAAPAKVLGKVGPGFTITLTMGGKKVTKLRSGVTYRFVITDRSEDHDFRLVGPGVNRTLTTEEFVGTRAVTVKLRKGAHRFFCAPHADDMRGGFRVV